MRMIYAVNTVIYGTWISLRYTGIPGHLSGTLTVNQARESDIIFYGTYTGMTGKPLETLVPEILHSDTNESL